MQYNREHGSSFLESKVVFILVKKIYNIGDHLILDIKNKKKGYNTCHVTPCRHLLELPHCGRIGPPLDIHLGILWPSYVHIFLIIILRVRLRISILPVGKCFLAFVSLSNKRAFI